jgi:hypothetical protein
MNESAPVGASIIDLAVPIVQFAFTIGTNVKAI